MPVLSGSLSHVNLTYWYTPVKLKLVTVLELENVLVALAASSMVISNQSVDAVGLADIEPCTLKEPVKPPLVYTAIVCSALLLLMPGLASMLLDRLANETESAVAVKPVTEVLATNCG